MSGWALGVDIGGTFTDLVALHRATGEIRTGKVLTDYGDLAAGVMRGVAEVLRDGTLSAADVGAVVHGTTLATNALIERRGAPTALLVTQGFRDILEMARESRYDIYDIELRVPPPLVPRRLVFEVAERVDGQGRVVTPLDEAALPGIVATLRAEGVRGVALCFLNSFRNPAHERRVAQRLAELAPELAVSASVDVMPDIREYERASTTVANAYVRPVVERYLAKLREELAALGVPAQPLIMTSDAATVSCATAALYPVRLVESGPAGGVLAAAKLGALCGVSDVIAFDMGGTTAKICVIDHGEPERSAGFEVARVHRFAKGSGLPLKVPVIEMIEIGAGGGSVARVNELGLLQVGPDSAGSEPGPACYGLGGTQPTVTDADLALGYLDAGYFLGGRMRLDPGAAARAIATHVAAPLGLAQDRAAWGIHAVVNDAMARAAKVHCLERGKDPRDYALVASGGAGPVHAYRVAEALGMSRVIFPLRAGVMSALGFLVAAPAFEMLRAVIAPLATTDETTLAAMLAEMEAEGRLQVASAGPAEGARVERHLALRFAGQSYALDVPFAEGATLAQAADAFRALYRQRFHQLNPNVPLELVHARVVVRATPPRVDLPRVPRVGGGSLKGRRRAYMPEQGGHVDCPVHDRYALGEGDTVQGPAIIEEAESTVVIGPGASGVVDGFGNLVVTLPPRRAAAAMRHEAAPA
jgi:N-methylhydantoinase A